MRICIFGDSVTYAGYIKNSWANLLRKHLENTANEGVELFNLGINGNTTEDILNRFESEVAPRQPSKIIFAIGVNDSGYTLATNEPLIEENKFKQNILKLIELVQKYTNDITFVGLVLGDDSLLKPYAESSTGKAYDANRVVKYDAIIKDIATDKNCKYIHLFDQLEYSDFSDGLHPNESGHNKMFQRLIALEI